MAGRTAGRAAHIPLAFTAILFFILSVPIISAADQTTTPATACEQAKAACQQLTATCDQAYQQNLQTATIDRDGRLKQCETDLDGCLTQCNSRPTCITPTTACIGGHTDCINKENLAFERDKTKIGNDKTDCMNGKGTIGSTIRSALDICKQAEQAACAKQTQRTCPDTATVCGTWTGCFILSGQTIGYRTRSCNCGGFGCTCEGLETRQTCSAPAKRGPSNVNNDLYGYRDQMQGKAPKFVLDSTEFAADLTSRVAGGFGNLVQSTGLVSKDSTTTFLMGSSEGSGFKTADTKDPNRWAALTIGGSTITKSLNLDQTVAPGATPEIPGTAYPGSPLSLGQGFGGIPPITGSISFPALNGDIVVAGNSAGTVSLGWNKRF